MDQNSRIYLDYAATTPVDERVLRAMIPYFNEEFGNPSSVHFYGQQAEAALENARETVASALNCKADEIIFTSCGTESDNLAIRGAVFTQRKLTGANRLLISPVEHPAVIETARQLAGFFGFVLEFLSVDEFGRVDPEEVKSNLRPDVALVSVIFANNEIGTINPIEDIAKICRSQGVLFHSDAVQAAAHLAIDLQKIPVDLLAIGAHKFYGPKGVGALYAAKNVQLMPVITGGKHENGLRAGTPNLPYIAGLAEALRLVVEEREQRVEHLKPMRDYLIHSVIERIPHSRLTGHPTQRLPNHASFVFNGVDGNLLLAMLDMAGFACSSGSACKVGNPKPSEILSAIGFSRSWAMGSLRVTLGCDTTAENIEDFLDVLPGIVERVRKIIS